jgi:hypothetical protein
MSISDFDEATGNELEVARMRLASAEGAVQMAKREWKAAKRRRREAKEAARRSKKRLKRAKEEFEVAHCAVTEAQKIDPRHVARVAKTKIKTRAIKRAKKKTEKKSAVPPAAATESVTDFAAQTVTGSEPGLVETMAEHSTAS